MVKNTSTLKGTKKSFTDDPKRPTTTISESPDRENSKNPTTVTEVTINEDPATPNQQPTDIHSVTTEANLNQNKLTKKPEYQEINNTLEELKEKNQESTSIHKGEKINSEVKNSTDVDLSLSSYEKESDHQSNQDTSNKDPDEDPSTPIKMNSTKKNE